jgi:hypothetical protein
MLRRFLVLFKGVVLRLVWVVVPLGSLYLCMAQTGLMRTPSTCMTETIQGIADPSGYDFKVTETGCSTIAKEGFVSVYISRARRNKPILLFKYDPAGAVPYPSITVSDKGQVKARVKRAGIARLPILPPIFPGPGCV